MHQDEEHELPCAEALIAAVLALMTGYGQSLLAGQPPEPRLLLATRIGEHLTALQRLPQLSAPFRTMLATLQRRWDGLGRCSAAAVVEADAVPPPAWAHAAPPRLQ